jgi:hypothetical protein
MDVRAILRRLSALSVCLIAFQCLTISAATLPQFRLQVYGLTDSTHTDLEGMRFSGPRMYGMTYESLLTSGRMFGDSAPFLESDFGGQSAWISNGQETQRIGLFDEGHTGPHGTQITVTYAVNQQGQAVGGSYTSKSYELSGGYLRYGISSWFYDGNETHRIGLYNSFDDDPARTYFEYVPFINERGDALGLSYTSTSSFQQAWLYDGAATRPIGLDDEQHRGRDGHVLHEILGLNNQGQAIGLANHYVDSTRKEIRGGSAWLYDGEKTVQLGFTDNIHTSHSGTASSTPVAILDSGLVAGHSLQYWKTGDCERCGDFAVGQTAWVYQDGVTRKVGFPELENFYGTGHAEIEHVSPAGLVAGVTRYQGGETWDHPLAWVDDGTQTVAIDIPEPDFPEGYVVRSNKSIVGFTSEGSVILNSGFFSDPHGLESVQAAWEYKDGSVRQLGLFDNDHRRSDGHTVTQVTQIAQGNSIIGTSEQFFDGQSISSTLWVDQGRGAVPLEVAKEGDDLSRLLFSELKGSNTQGQLAGNTIYWTEDDHYATRPWFYDPLTGPTSIDVPQTMEMYMQGLTETGWVYGNLGPFGESYYGLNNAFLWHASTGLVMLRDLIVEPYRHPRLSRPCRM